jgi:hypothetical protein
MDPDNDDKSYVIVANKKDPTGPHPIMPEGQLAAGEPITYQIDWSEGSKETAIRFYAHRKRVEHPVLVHDLATATPSEIDTSELYEIACIPVKKALHDSGSSIVVLSVYMSLPGRTIQVEVQKFEPGSAIDFQRAHRHVLQKLACSTLQLVGSLNIHEAKGARMTYLDINMNSG